jgi:hypothetical protein
MTTKPIRPRSSWTGGVPALHDAVEALRQFGLAEALEPFRLDQAAAQRRESEPHLQLDSTIVDAAASRAASNPKNENWFQLGAALSFMPGPRGRRNPIRLNKNDGWRGGGSGGVRAVVS